MEVMCYGIIFVTVRRSNREVAPFLSAGALRNRNRKNILTFMNQVAIFGVEILGYLMIFLTMVYPAGRSLAVIYTVLNPLLPLATVFASNPLRQAAKELLRIR